MNPYASYRAINTKLHRKKGMLLKQNEWEKLVGYRNVNQVVEFLKRREEYKPFILLYETRELHRAELEVILSRYRVKETESILHYLSGPYKGFFRVFLMEYDIHDLQLILRTIVREEEMKGIENNLIHSKQYGLSIYDKLIGCKSIPQFIEMLRGTPYYDALKTVTEEDLTRREFHMEMKLYVLFYKTLLEAAEKLSKKDYEIIREIVGLRIDWINVQWIYRAMKYYDISHEEMLIYSIPGGSKLSYSKLKKLIYVPSIESFKRLAGEYLSYNLFKEAQDTFLDCKIERYRYHALLRCAQDEESIRSAITYIYLLETEMNDLISVTEGIRYTLPESQIRRYLVHTI